MRQPELPRYSERRHSRYGQPISTPAELGYSCALEITTPQLFERSTRFTHDERAAVLIFLESVATPLYDFFTNPRHPFHENALRALIDNPLCQYIPKLTASFELDNSQAKKLSEALYLIQLQSEAFSRNSTSHHNLLEYTTGLDVQQILSECTNTATGNSVRQLQDWLSNIFPHAQLLRDVDTNANNPSRVTLAHDGIVYKWINNPDDLQREYAVHCHAAKRGIPTPIPSLERKSNQDFLTMLHLSDHLPLSAITQWIHSEAAWPLLHNIATLLDHLQRAGIVNLDLKPSNLLLSKDGLEKLLTTKKFSSSLQIIDWGSSHTNTASGSEFETTWAYHPFLALLEEFYTNGDFTARSNIYDRLSSDTSIKHLHHYALIALIYECMTHNPIFTEAEVMGIWLAMLAHKHQLKNNHDEYNRLRVSFMNMLLPKIEFLALKLSLDPRLEVHNNQRSQIALDLFSLLRQYVDPKNKLRSTTSELLQQIIGNLHPKRRSRQ